MLPAPRRVRLLDYGMGNLRSVTRALQAAGADVEVTQEVGGDWLVLPGQGAFDEAARRLTPYWEALQAYARSGKPLLGICVGMQLLFERSYEHGTTPGLGIFPGEVVPIPTGVTVPNMGWHRLQGLGNPFAYFAHSYAVPAFADAIATIEHGGQWTAAVKRGPQWGFQFHPEKSGAAGIRLVEEWLKC
ncbi:MAG TPA: imidazole glycerol phosphate synthase subunit HisH [Myxococcaceae bacterium]|nr:imidazole glycerol phosphate synthase subunit HisH [Myxococcaceae bacterium]